MDNPAKRKCDYCGINYLLNAREIPRINIIKRIDISELESKEYMASPDFCKNCTNMFLDKFEKQYKLRFKIKI